MSVHAFKNLLNKLRLEAYGECHHFFFNEFDQFNITVVWTYLS